MTGYEAKRNNQKFGHRGKFQNAGGPFNPAAYDESQYLEHVDPLLIGLLDNKRGSHLPQRSAPKNVDFSFPNKTLQDLKYQSFSPEQPLRSSIHSPSFNTRYNAQSRGGQWSRKARQGRNRGPMSFLNSVWIPDNMSPRDAQTSTCLLYTSPSPRDA